ncbi:MAG: outer membrane beta-barrel protein, partial [Crocinitomix sp.]|nr:outer membrane beta-barrel protein [Crocinitomix sp.]
MISFNYNMLSLLTCLKGLILTALFFVPMISTFSQVVNPATLDTTGGARIKDLTIGAYLDLYYGFSFDEQSDHVVPYMTNSNYANEVNVNLAFIDVRYQTERLRARFVPGFGTYINANYASETGSL